MSVRVDRDDAVAIVTLDRPDALNALNVETLSALRDELRELSDDVRVVVLTGAGDRAFAAGNHAGTVLDVLSPLASPPPQPLAHWVFLVDSSGSMNAPE